MAASQTCSPYLILRSSWTYCSRTCYIWPLVLHLIIITITRGVPLRSYLCVRLYLTFVWIFSCVCLSVHKFFFGRKELGYQYHSSHSLCGAENSDLQAVINCTAAAMIFQKSAPAMMDDVNLISPTDLYWRKFRHSCQPRDVFDHRH